MGGAQEPAKYTYSAPSLYSTAPFNPGNPAQSAAFQFDQTSECNKTALIPHQCDSGN